MALKALGVSKGTPVGIYMGMGPGLPVAMLACARLGAPHTVVFGGFSADSLAGAAQRHAVRGRHHAGRGLAPRTDGAAQGECRRGARVVPGREDSRRRPAHDGRRADGRGPRRHVARAHRRTAVRSGHVPVRADGRGGPALPPLYERHDREAEGHRSHDGRLPRRRRHDAQLHLRPEARRRRVLVRSRHRLGHRAQLHRLRAAVQRLDERPLRGRAGLPRPRPLVGHRRALRRDDPLHRARRPSAPT